MRRDDLRRLGELADMKRDAELQELSRIAARMAALQHQIDQLRAQVRARAESISLDPARLSGADVVWQQWVATAIRRLQQQMLTLAIEREAHLAKARLSFGRAEALRRLREGGQDRKR